MLLRAGHVDESPAASIRPTWRHAFLSRWCRRFSCHSRGRFTSFLYGNW